MATTAAPQPSTEPLNLLLIPDICLSVIRFLEPPEMRLRAKRAGFLPPTWRDSLESAENGGPKRTRKKTAGSVVEEIKAWRELPMEPPRGPRGKWKGKMMDKGDLDAVSRVCRVFREAALPSLFYLVELDLLSPDKVTKLALILQQDERGHYLASLVRHLRLRNARILSTHYLSILKSTLPHIRALDLTRARLRSSAPHKPPLIFDLIPPSSQLRAINLSYADWDYSERGASKLFSAVMEKCKDLEFLGMEHCGPVGGKVLSRVLCGLPRLGDVRFGSAMGVFSARSVEPRTCRGRSCNADGVYTIPTDNGSRSNLQSQHRSLAPPFQGTKPQQPSPQNSNTSPSTCRASATWISRTLTRFLWLCSLVPRFLWASLV